MVALSDAGWYLILTLIVTIGMQLSFFAIAATFKFDKVTDLAGSMNFVVLAWLTFWLQGTEYPRQIVILCLVSAWGFRLGGFLLYRVLQRGKDARFDDIRGNFCRFLGFWVYQMIWVWVVSLPVTFVNAASYDAPLSAVDYIGWVLWGIGFFFQAVGDQSKLWFSEDKANKGKILTTGVWSWSRHPNYFGEIVMWLGIFLTSSGAYAENTQWAYFSVASPLFTYLLLMYASGVKLTEDRYNNIYKGNPEWVAYRERTSVLIPVPPFIFTPLPYSIKWLFFCEYKIFALKDEADSSREYLTLL